MRKIFVIVLFICLLSQIAFAQNAQQLVDQMVKNGFNRDQALRLFAQWKSGKEIIINLATSGDNTKRDLAKQIVDYRYQAFQETWTETAKDAVKQGVNRPVDAMVPTGGWKAPLALRDKDPIEYIKKAANADFDATFFCKNNYAERYVENALIKWAEKTTGMPMVDANGNVNYAKINELMRQSEVTMFPRDPDGKLSQEFQKKFPEIVHEGYPGAYGQRSLEVTYMLDKAKAKADIVLYDKSGNIVTQDGKVRIVENQPAENVIEDLTKAKYTSIDRMNKITADYELKFKGHMTGDFNEDSSNTAKMLQRMIEEESKIKGLIPKDHPFYDKAKAIKEAIRENDNEALKTALKGQALDDFLDDAKNEISRINMDNKRRLADAMDEGIGSPANTKLDSALKILTVLGYGYTATDAYLKAKDDEKLKEVTKAMTVALAADLAGTATAAAAGKAAVAAGAGAIGAGGASIVSGIGAGFVAAMIVSCGIEWTEEGINNMLSGYKVDGTIKNMFLTEDKIKEFLQMSPDEIKKYIESEWDQQHQWSGAYYGKSADEAAQGKLKDEIFQQALEVQARLNEQSMKAKVVGDIILDEYKRIVDKYERGEITEAQLEAEKANLKENLNDIIEKRLGEDYRHYQMLFEEAEKRGEKGGLWDMAFGDSKEKREQVRADADKLYNEIMESKDYLERDITRIISMMDEIRQAYADGTKIEDLSDKIADLAKEAEGLTGDLYTLENDATDLLSKIQKTYGTLDDQTRYLSIKSELLSMLASMSKKVRDVNDQSKEFLRIFKLLQEAAEKNKQEQQEGEEESKGPSKRDDYEILEISADLVPVQHENKTYQKLKHIEASSVLIKIRGEKHRVTGRESTNLLIEKGFFYLIEKVGIVASEKYNSFVKSKQAPEQKQEPEKQIKGCGFLREHFENCQRQYGQDYNFTANTLSRAYKVAPDLGNAYKACMEFRDDYNRCKQEQNSDVRDFCQEELPKCRNKYGSSPTSFTTKTVPAKEYTERLKCANVEKQCAGK